MSILKLFAIVVGLTVLFAPAANAVAMATPHHGMRMMETSHCQSPPAGTAHNDKMDGKSCCIAMCAAVAIAVATAAPAEPLLLRQQLTRFALPKSYHGLHAEIATPPPRLS